MDNEVSPLHGKSKKPVEGSTPKKEFFGFLSSSGRPSSSSLSSSTENIIRNHDFSAGFDSWKHSSGTEGLLFTAGSAYHNEIAPHKGSNYVVVKDRSQTWHGLEQDITGGVETGCTYKLTAFVRVSSFVEHGTKIAAELRLEDDSRPNRYQNITRLFTSGEGWRELEGMFTLSTSQKRVIFHLGEAVPRTDLMVNYVTIEKFKEDPKPEDPVIRNGDFSEGLAYWYPTSDKGFVVKDKSEHHEGTAPKPGSNNFVVTDRSRTWHGLEQDISGRLATDCKYTLTALVRISRVVEERTRIAAELRLEKEYNHKDKNYKREYLKIISVPTSGDRWETLKGSFTLPTWWERVFLHLEVADPYIDLLVNSVSIEKWKPGEAEV